MAAAVVARALGVHVRTVRGWIASGALPGTHVMGRAGRRRWYAYRSEVAKLRAKSEPDSPEL